MPWTAKTHRAHATAPGTVPVPLAGDDHAVQMVPAAPAILTTTDLKARIGTASLAFRGYDVQNLGRTPELLAHPVYGATVRRYLDLASAVAADALHRPFDLAARVERREETTLAAFAEDVALIVSMELAQLALLDEFFGVSAKGAPTDVRLQHRRTGFGGVRRPVHDGRTVADPAGVRRRLRRPRRRDDARRRLLARAGGAAEGRAGSLHGGQRRGQRDGRGVIVHRAEHDSRDRAGRHALTPGESVSEAVAGQDDAAAQAA